MVGRNYRSGSQARTSFLIKSTYDVPLSQANLIRWSVATDEKCKCGEYGTLRHVLSGCKLGLHGGRYTLRHDQVLSVISKALEYKLRDINAGNLPKKQELDEMLVFPIVATNRGPYILI